MRGQLLVVDDNPGYRRLVREALVDDPDFQVVGEAATAEEAVAAAARLHPGAALVDVLLPGGGFRLATALQGVAPDCAIVLTSAHLEGDLDAMSHLGSIAFLPKSVAPAHLGRALGGIVSLGDRSEEARQRADLQLPASRDSPRVARRFVEATLTAWGCGGLVDTATLLVSELVGNAVLHADSEVGLSLRLLAERLRVEVADRSILVPHRRAAAEDDLTGRGSGLVELLASSWGITGRADGKSVWFELGLEPEPGR